MKKKMLLVGITLALVVAIVVSSISVMAKSSKDISYSYPETDIALDYNGDGITDNLFTVAVGSDGSLIVDYYLPGEAWGETMTIVGTEAYVKVGEGKKAEWKVIDNFDPWTHPLIAEKLTASINESSKKAGKVYPMSFKIEVVPSYQGN